MAQANNLKHDLNTSRCLTITNLILDIIYYSISMCVTYIVRLGTNVAQIKCNKFSADFYVM